MFKKRSLDLHFHLLGETRERLGNPGLGGGCDPEQRTSGLEWDEVWAAVVQETLALATCGLGHSDGVSEIGAEARLECWGLGVRCLVEVGPRCLRRLRSEREVKLRPLEHRRCP